MPKFTPPFEFTTKLEVKEQLSEGKPKTSSYCSTGVPAVEIEIFNGMPSIVLTGYVAESPDKDWDGVPALAYNRNVCVRLGPSTCDAIIKALNDGQHLSVFVAKGDKPKGN